MELQYVLKSIELRFLSRGWILEQVIRVVAQGYCYMYIIYSRLIICHLGNLWGSLIIIFQLSALGNYLEFEMHSNSRLTLIGNES